MIHALRGVASASAAMHADPERGISTIAWLEVLQGAADKRRQRLAVKFVESFGFAEHPLSGPIGTRAVRFLKVHALADGLGLADALIAATAVEAGLPLLTGNHKHFNKLEGLEVVRFRP